MSNQVAFEPRGRYFEQFNLGDKVVTQARTISESDIVTFAGLSGDFNQIHTDAVYAAEEQFGQRIAHGLLIQSIATGLSVLTGFIEGTVIAFRELTCKFSAPVFIGDTIHVVLEIVELKALPRLGGGNAVMKWTVVNQDGKVVQRGTWTMLVKSLPK
ncbi:MAG: MaoC/PaaZ C-terminal domain-containing protein [Ardenticatenaceae bacterium]|nr:MaoC/PaaZ C-terminal domain-containing protein [Ardenticatenaceae bacterium]